MGSPRERVYEAKPVPADTDADDTAALAMATADLPDASHEVSGEAVDVGDDADKGAEDEPQPTTDDAGEGDEREDSETGA